MIQNAKKSGLQQKSIHFLFFSHVRYVDFPILRVGLRVGLSYAILFLKYALEPIQVHNSWTVHFESIQCSMVPSRPAFGIWLVAEVIGQFSLYVAVVRLCMVSLLWPVQPDWTYAALESRAESISSALAGLCLSSLFFLFAANRVQKSKTI